MNHTYKQAGNMSIAPPPETPLNEVNFEEGVYKHLPPREEGAFYYG